MGWVGLNSLVEVRPFIFIFDQAYETRRFVYLFTCLLVHLFTCSLVDRGMEAMVSKETITYIPTSESERDEL